MNEPDINQEGQIILRRMIWVHTEISVFILFLVANIAIWVLVSEFIYKVASFLVVSMITLILWRKWSKLVKELL